MTASSPNSKRPAPPKALERARTKAPPEKPPIDLEERRSEARYTCDYKARIASSDRQISTAARIVNISLSGARVEVMFPRRGPTTILLFDLDNSEIYECEVNWRTDMHIGVRFLDVLGPGRRRRFFAGEPIPVLDTKNKIIQRETPPNELVLKGPPPLRLGMTPSMRFEEEDAKPKPWQAGGS